MVDQGGIGLGVINVDGTNAHSIILPDPVLSGNYQKPAWSPDGARIAAVYYSYIGESAKIVTLSPTGANLTTVATAPTGADLLYPFWSPDSRSIGYLEDDNVGTDGYRLFTVMATGGTPSLIRTESHGIYGASWGLIEPSFSSVMSNIVQYQQDGSITKLGTSLTDKLAQAQAQKAAGDVAGAQATLRSLVNQIRAQSGKHITAAAATALIAQIQELMRTL
jgi:Tol biopolymer transport system component